MKKLALLAIFAVLSVGAFATSGTHAAPVDVTVNLTVLKSATLSTNLGSVDLSVDPQQTAPSHAGVIANYATNFTSSLDLSILALPGFTFTATWDDNSSVSHVTAPTNEAHLAFTITAVANDFLTIADNTDPYSTTCTVTLTDQ